MKFIFIISVLLSALNAQAQRLVRAEIKSPYVMPQCQTVGLDSIGTLGLFDQNFSYKDSANDVMSLTVNNSLATCRLYLNEVGTKRLSWLTVDPFQGFEVQYFNDNSQSIQLRKVWMDSAKPYNRLELVLMSPENGKIWRNNMISKSNGGFGAELSIKKSQLLTASDLQQLRQGNVVRKTVELYHIFNSTTLIDNKPANFGDQPLAGRTVFLYFAM